VHRVKGNGDVSKPVTKKGPFYEANHKQCSLTKEGSLCIGLRAVELSQNIL